MSQETSLRQSGRFVRRALTAYTWASNGFVRVRRRRWSSRLGGATTT